MLYAKGQIMQPRGIDPDTPILQELPDMPVKKSTPDMEKVFSFNSLTS
jgi:hypothetical protein